MTKKDILTKIKKTILGEEVTPGIANTNKVKKSEKDFNDAYYKDTDKKFKDYLGIKKDDFDAPKVNADEKQEKSYGGSGMEGLTYDNEGTQVAKKFKKRVDDLNKPSKDYYLKKDEINDTYGKLNKKAKSYKEEKEVYQNTPPVRAVEAKKLKSESTIKRLTYKTEFINESFALKLIPENFKKDNLIFEMTDGNKLIKIRWEGGLKGNPVVLLSKDNKKISQELDRMRQLFEYNSRDNFTKSNLLTEEKELGHMLNTIKGSDEVSPDPKDKTNSDQTTDKMQQVVAQPKEIAMKLTQSGNKFSAAKYVEDRNIPVTPGIIASYEPITGIWEINFSQSLTKEDLLEAVKLIMDKNAKSNKIKTDLRAYLSKNRNSLGSQKFDTLITLVGGA